jgi:hypothetical protein
MKIVITATGKGDNMKRFGATAFALALLLSLGVLPGCGLLGRTVPDGFYGEPERGVKIRPTDPGGNVRYDLPYWTVEEDGTMVLTDPYGNKMPHKGRKVITDN